MEKFQPLWSKLAGKEARARDIAARTIEACNEAGPDRIDPGGEDDRNGRACCFLPNKRHSASGHNDHGHLATHQIIKHRWQAIVDFISPAVFDGDVSPLRIAGFCQSLLERA